VLDNGGHLKALKREDGGEHLASDDCYRQSMGAIGMGESSRQLGERLKDRPSFLGALSDMSGGKVVPVAGGVLIIQNSTIIGAVGISGGTAEEDETSAVEGIKASDLDFKT
jgi:uncharacterized protein GlcG (DUF336 family)